MQKPYLEWISHISLDDVFSKTNTLKRSSLDSNSDTVFWKENKSDGTCIVQSLKNGEIKQITPDNMNVGSMVHEYGGKSFTVTENMLYFSNRKDQRLYQVDLESVEVTPITTVKNKDGSQGRYVTPTVSPDGKLLVFAYEKAYDNQENENFLAAIPLDGKQHEAQIIASGYDFYADPIFSSDGRLAWLAWKKPYMPFESTQLFIANFNNDSLQITDEMEVLHDKTATVCSPRFDHDNNLYFISDFAGKEEDDPKNWWNIYCFTKDDDIKIITSATDREYGVPYWGMGRQILEIVDGYIFAIYYKDCKTTLVRIDRKTLNEEKLSSMGYSEIYAIKSYQGGIVLITMFSDSGDKIISFDEKERVLYEVSEAPNFPVQEVEVHIVNFGKEKTHFNFYHPLNPNFTAPEGELPPAMVMVHGGPTSRTELTFSKQLHYFLSLGYALIDINHRGSTGYGRKYRDKLEHQYGIVEMEDIYEIVKYCKEKKMISDRVVIQGGSAGGYSVQRSLTLHPNLFSAGASYYGIGNLFTLINMALEHHKFEAYYGVYLFGGMPNEVEGVYRDRSPVYHFDKIITPMILFQGLDDKVVHPKNSREIASALEKNGIKYELIEYEGEGHGFRNIDNVKDSLLHMISFFKEVLEEN